MQIRERGEIRDLYPDEKRLVDDSSFNRPRSDFKEYVKDKVDVGRDKEDYKPKVV